MCSHLCDFLIVIPILGGVSQAEDRLRSSKESVGKKWVLPQPFGKGVSFPSPFFQIFNLPRYLRSLKTQIINFLLQLGSVITGARLQFSALGDLKSATDVLPSLLIFQVRYFRIQ